jgi:hypothetical protein
VDGASLGGAAAGVAAGADGGGDTGWAGMLLASGLGRYSGPRCPHADSMLNNMVIIKKEATPGNGKVDFTIKISVLRMYWSVA